MFWHNIATYKFCVFVCMYVKLGCAATEKRSKSAEQLDIHF